jgi:hypothetical protein
MEAKRLLMKLEDEQTGFSAEEFTKKLKNQSRKTTVIQFLDEVIEDFHKADKVGNANVHKNLRNVILRFRNQKDFTFSELDGSFLRKFEQDFRERGVSEVSMSITFELFGRCIIVLWLGILLRKNLTLFWISRFLNSILKLRNVLSRKRIL